VSQSTRTAQAPIAGHDGSGWAGISPLGIISSAALQPSAKVAVEVFQGHEVVGFGPFERLVQAGCHEGIHTRFPFRKGLDRVFVAYLPFTLFRYDCAVYAVCGSH
jgi:hypothetical protein